MAAGKCGGNLDIISDRELFQLKEQTATAMGKFDGLHMGHRKLLNEILEQKKNGLKACVFTFEPAPSVLFGVGDGKELTTREEKRLLFQNMGIDILIEYPLNLETAAMDPERFVRDVLWKQMNCQVIAAGTDLSFGAGGAGNRKLLADMGEELGFAVKIIDKVMLDGAEVSSTYVRSQVEAGNMALVERLLDMPYFIAGKVVYGNQIGRTMGMPTANLIPDGNKLMPPGGVYYSRVLYRGQSLRAISNIGYKPTVSQTKVFGIESYIYDFNKDIYGEEIQVSLLEYRRPEQKFSGMEELKAVMEQDLEEGRIWKR